MDRSNKRIKTKEMSLFRYRKKNAISILKLDLKILKNKNIRHNRNYCMEKIEIRTQIEFINEMTLKEYNKQYFF